jgi:hypothetical protein
MPMTGMQESKLTYPEFYRLPGGRLMFLYRDGGSGNGSLVMNQYDVKTKIWTQLHNNLIDGEGKRNAYWQVCVDSKGGIHLSWVWRETPDVSSNHDLCYAFSKDGGNTWQKSTGEIYNLPITASSAEYAFYIPEKSELINQTSMFADDEGNPYIATYWREEGTNIPQYHVVHKSKNGWMKEAVDFRKTAFSLSGVGSKNIPISRPQILAWKNKDKMQMALIFRDEERDGKVSMAVNKSSGSNEWTIADLTKTSVGSWEPSYDTELWKEKEILHLFVQKIEQVDAEGMGSTPAQMVYVLECDPKKSF